MQARVAHYLHWQVEAPGQAHVRQGANGVHQYLSTCRKMPAKEKWLVATSAIRARRTRRSCSDMPGGGVGARGWGVGGTHGCLETAGVGVARWAVVLGRGASRPRRDPSGHNFLRLSLKSHRAPAVAGGEARPPPGSQPGHPSPGQAEGLGQGTRGLNPD
jgi:hypothetical protein